MDAAAEFGRNPVSKHDIQTEYGDEQADAGRDCRTRLARPNSQARTNAGREIFIFPVRLTTSRIGNLTWLIHPYSCYMCDHTYIIKQGSNNILFYRLQRQNLYISIFPDGGSNVVSTVQCRGEAHGSTLHLH